MNSSPLKTVDCRSLVEFCRAYEQHRITSVDHHRIHTKRGKSPNPNRSPLLCENSPSAALDIAMLLLVLGSVGVLTVPYLKFFLHGASDLLPVALDLLNDAVFFDSAFAYAAGFTVMFATAFAGWEVVGHQFRKCGKPYCKGQRKAVEFDIQIEPEECVKYLASSMKEGFETRLLELGEDYRELEAELKKMAPMNGRTVLIFRSRCGCAAGRMEVWGPKRVRRIKK